LPSCRANRPTSCSTARGPWLRCLSTARPSGTPARRSRCRRPRSPRWWPGRGPGGVRRGAGVSRSAVSSPPCWPRRRGGPPGRTNRTRGRWSRPATHCRSRGTPTAGSTSRG
jgi:hypothetical protein